MIKVRASDEISADSVGRGVRIPAFRIPSQLHGMNRMLELLGYTPVDVNWQMTTTPPTLLRLPMRGRARVRRRGVQRGAAYGNTCLPRLTPRCAAVSSNMLTSSPLSGANVSPFAVVAYSLAEPRVAQAWRFDPASGEVRTDVSTEFGELDVDSAHDGAGQYVAPAR